MRHTTTRIRLPLVAAIAALAAHQVACTGDGMGGADPVVFPTEARAGSTAAIVVDSNYVPLDGAERYDLDADDIEIYIVDEAGPQLATLRSVFDAGSRIGEATGYAIPGAWATVAVFDLPSSLSFSSYPATDVAVEVRIFDGQGFVADPERTGRITILDPAGTGGTPLPGFFPNLQNLQSKSMIQLRPRVEPGFFEEAWQIGALELDLQFPAICNFHPRAYPQHGATHGLVILGPGLPASSYPLDAARRVSLIHPEGFLPRPGDSDGGEGPVLVLVFPDNICAGSVGVDSDFFRLRRLYVADVNGQVLADLRDDEEDPDVGDGTEEYFHITVIGD